MQTSQRSLWTSRAWPRHMHEFSPFPSLPPVSSAFPSRRFPWWISRAVLSRSPWDFMEISFTHASDSRLLPQPPFSALLSSRRSFVTWFPNTSANFGSPRGFMRLWTRKIWVLKWQSKLWPHCNVGRLQRRTKMATELELAEEMSNSSPERAMELLSSIGEPQLLMLYITPTKK